MFLYNYLSNVVFSNSVEKAQPAPTPQNSNSSSKQKKPNNNNTHSYYHEYHKFNKSSFNKSKYSSSTKFRYNNDQDQDKMPPSAYSNFHTPAYTAATMNSPNNNNAPNKAPQSRRVIDSESRCKIVDDICAETNLYNILGVERTCSSEELRRAYISVSVFSLRANHLGQWIRSLIIDHTHSHIHTFTHSLINVYPLLLEVTNLSSR